MTAEKSIKILKAVKMLKDDAIGTLIDTTDAYKMAIEALSKQCASGKQVHGPELFGQKTIVEPGEVFVGENVLKKALDQSADSGKTIVLKKRTIIERLTIAESLINSVIADSNQFREDAKKTDDVLINLPSAQPEINCSEFPNGSDTISRRAAIDAVLKLTYADGAYGYTDAKDLVDSLENLPSAQPEIKTDGDMISRQQTIDALMQEFKRIPTNSIRAKLVVENLPSAQPENIYCKDCKHLQKWRSEESAKKFGQIYECARNVLDCPEPEDFCSHAERRTDG